MMHVESMRRIVDVIEHGEMPFAAQLAAQQFQGHDLVYVRSSANHVFRLTCQERRSFLRLSHATEHKREAIEAELDFLSYLAARGLRVATPLLSATGSYIEAITDEDQHYFAVVFEAMPGDHLAIGDLTQVHWEALGRSLSLLHEASRLFPSHPGRGDLRDDLGSLLSTLPEMDQRVKQALQAGICWLSTFPAQTCGLIHGDFELDNLLWDGTQWGVIDFDSASYTWYGADIIIALEDLWAEPLSACTQAFEWFAAGYTEHSHLPVGTVDAIPTMRNLNRAIKIADLRRAYASLQQEDAPAWLQKMQSNHQSWMKRQLSDLR